MIGHNVVGRGPRHVLVLHGWLGDSEVFAPALSSLDLDAFTYTFMDYRGYGRSLEQNGAYTLDEISRDAQALVDHLGWGRFAILGHSMGGAAALRLAVDAPGRVTALIAATPVPASGVPMPSEGQQLFGNAVRADEARQGILNWTTGGRYTPAWARGSAARLARFARPEAMGGYLDAWTKANFAGEARGLSIPILVIVGEHDGGVTAEAMHATYLADYPNAILHVLPACGHYPMQEVPILFASEVERFLDAHMPV
ncbi:MULTISPECIES: alpha/beta hydrolase [unclassified Beijerinckia]|uniref:alpha/beta fold hydrolase n=1 Tax=unclassified Beijerinckia TaxID=2638183 RepID=UPI000897E2CD|nr:MULTISPECIES: alpha/beta hydrolase [unclassified Beijerinckia]MDH7799060.1 pimeloyl-ACP methyl ester carboxylesterase [Beijerinckia sp. GAS462]SED96379.1 Pimeloyl-ACP methyl ester carboxylesterase [Beijerinckia sp. 28-YEA-48]